MSHTSKYLMLIGLILTSQAYAAPITDFSDPALANGVTINFDQYTTNEYLNDFSVGPVSFVDTIQFGGNYFSQDAFGIGQSGRVIGLYGEALINFDTPINAVAFSLMAINATSWEMNALNANGDLIEHLNIVKPIGSAAKVFGIAAPGISSIQILSGTSGINLDAITMDDFVYATVPIPSAVLLLLSGITILGTVARKHSNGILRIAKNHP
ncbi:MAG: VPLPA-CTERM sorting domain-containing protein [Pseudomonadota bacterium]